MKAITSCLVSPQKISTILNLEAHDPALPYVSDKIDDELVHQVVKTCLNKIVIYPARLELHLSQSSLTPLLSQHFNIELAGQTDGSHIETIPFHTRRGDRVNIITAPAAAKRDPFDKSPTELKNWIRGIVWRDEFHDGVKIEDIARRENLSARYVGRLIEASLNP